MSALESKESSEAQGSGDDLTSQLSSNQIEKLEEAKLMAKYPLAGGGHSSFLQKRLNKNQKYFDSGDYQMAKQTTLTGPNKMLPQSTYNTGNTSVAITRIENRFFNERIPSLSAC
ncbi:cAMP-regulated phosphoprotein/endosulfine conserved region [Nesidiocoris tenuis]|uniref:cAMP-regulated phosphoprotein/endosulfine conserved region n=1 Tax=Nesidiocoris tenuis TaxID=355587 RepID=A0ABN7ADN9_9HEMI|nr:cAMP-regulated phosphoprotein/endosulfine conserved region [Nesidiocoris tenuis]